jgi:hypothetical protein
MVIYEDIFREFQRKNVRYVLVGGIAVNLLGSLRNTADMDILVEMSNDNLAKIVRILKKRGYSVRQPVDPMGIADKRTREDWIKNKHMKAFNFYKEDKLREVDIIIDSPVTFERARRDVVWIKSGDIKLPVISINNLIKMKKKTARAIDKLDIEELKRIKRLRGIR